MCVQGLLYVDIISLEICGSVGTKINLGASFGLTLLATYLSSQLNSFWYYCDQSVVCSRDWHPHIGQCGMPLLLL